MKLQHTDPQTAANEDGFDAISMIVDALRAKFGEDALAVARVQHQNAAAESSVQWSEVVSRLSR